MADSEDSGRLYWNYIAFCCLYSTAHGAVDAVLAYSTTELGELIGSNGGAGLYICYTASAFFFAKPILRRLGSRNSIFCGLCGMLLYVASFLLALQNPAYANSIFTTGGILGGLGAGLLWPAQGAYFSTSAIKYAAQTDDNTGYAIILFASTFSGIYLGLETIFKTFATFVYLLLGANSSWHMLVFGSYTVAAYCSVVAFGIFLPAILKSERLEVELLSRQTRTKNMETTDGGDGKTHLFRKVALSQHADSIEFEDNTENDEINAEEYLWTNLFHFPDFLTLRCDLISVTNAIRRDRILQFMIPYQVCFGFSACFVGYYVNRNIVAKYIGDGYIGLLSGLSTLCAALLSYPFGYISNMSGGRGKWYVMIFGALCFCLSGLGPLILTDEKLANWYLIVTYYCAHGAARGCWENTNKAVVAEYFSNEDARETAFATIYFTSGLSGATGFYFYTLVPLIALMSYHYSDYLFHLNYSSTNTDSSSNSNSSSSSNSKRSSVHNITTALSDVEDQDACITDDS
jgi:MFS family permease